MQSFLREQEKPPGAALAVARHGRLVYARGFGLADREGTEPVEPRSLFRIASISKPITATAIMQLVERQKLPLDAKVIEVLGLSVPADERVEPDHDPPFAAAHGGLGPGGKLRPDVPLGADCRGAKGRSAGDAAADH